MAKRTTEYLEEVLAQARGYLPDYLWEEIHDRALAHAGGESKSKNKEARDGNDETAEEGAPGSEGSEAGSADDGGDAVTGKLSTSTGVPGGA